MKCQHLEAELGQEHFALRRSDSVGVTSLSEGEIIIIIIITNNSPILGREISINIFNSTISSQTLVHLLFNLCTGILHCCLWVTSSVDYIL